MISLELSSIQQKTIESAILAKAVDRYLDQGGQIIEAPMRATIHRVFSHTSATDSKRDNKSVHRRRSKSEVLQGLRSARIIPDIEEALSKKERENAKNRDLVMGLAPTMTQGEVAAKTGISRRRLYSMAQAYGFEFKAAIRDTTKNLVHDHICPERDAKNVERIKSLRDLGISQRKAAEHMRISRALFARLVRDYSIDYPAVKR